MKKRLLTLIILLSIAFCTGCEKEPIKIGFAGSLTGSNSELGVTGMYGAQMAADDLNKAGGLKGQKVELIIKDDKGNQQDALMVDKALQEEGCIAIVGHMTSDMADLTIPFANENQILMVSPTMAVSSLTGKDDYFFRLIPTTDKQAERLAREVAAQEFKEVQILYTNQNTVFAECIYQYLISDLKKKNIHTELIGPVERDLDSPKFEKLVKDIGESSSDALVIIAASDFISELSQELYKLGVEKTVFLPTWAMTDDLLENGGPSTEGYFGVNFVDFELESPEYLEFRNSYIKKYGSEPTFSSILSYESLMLVAQSIELSKTLNPSDLKNAIVQTGQFQGLQGTLFIDPFGDIERRIYLYQIQHGKFIKVD